MLGEEEFNEKQEEKDVAVRYICFYTVQNSLFSSFHLIPYKQSKNMF